MPIQQSTATILVLGLTLVCAASGQVQLLNRENDCLPMENGSQLTCGVNLLVQANDNTGQALSADGGMFLASQKDGSASDGRFAGENRGGGSILSCFTFIRGLGSYISQGGSTWIEPPQNAYRDLSIFKDVQRGRTQPPAPQGTPLLPMFGGLPGTNDPSNPFILQPGTYFAVSSAGIPTGDPIEISGHVVFSPGPNGFGDYVFIGGIATQQADITFGPGRYVFAGVKRSTDGGPGTLFDVRDRTILRDFSPQLGQNADPGEIFIFTDLNYPGLAVPQLPPEVASQLQHGVAGFRSSSGAELSVNLHGLRPDDPRVPADLSPYAPILIWQDRTNSIVKYNAYGYLDLSCGSVDACPNTALVDNRSPELHFRSSAAVNLYGIIYQPRGAWMTIAGGAVTGPLMLVTGSLVIRGNGSLETQHYNNPFPPPTCVPIPLSAVSTE